MRLDDGLLGLVLLAFALAVVTYAQGFPVLAGMQFGPALFPTVIGIGLGLCGIALIAQSWTRRRAGAHLPWVALEAWTKQPRFVLGPPLVVLLVIVFTLILEPLGFHTAALSVVLPLLLWLRVQPLKAVPIAIVGVLMVHQVFAQWLRVPLPWGVLEPVAW